MYFSISEQNTIPEYCLKLESWQGPPHINKLNQYKLCCPLMLVCYFSLLSHETKMVSLFSLFRQ